MQPQSGVDAVFDGRAWLHKPPTNKCGRQICEVSVHTIPGHGYVLAEPASVSLGWIQFSPTARPFASGGNRIDGSGRQDSLRATQSLSRANCGDRQSAPVRSSRLVYHDARGGPGDHGEAEASGTAFRSLPKYDQDSVIEFLKSLQILPATARSLCVDENGKDTDCPPGIQP